MTPTILITGWAGQVGGALLRSLAGIGSLVPADLVEPTGAFGAQRVDLADPESIRRLIRHVRPQIIVNPAAYTAVDKAESETDLAHKVNGIAPGIIGEEAKALGAGVIHYSTDYVFDGSGDQPWTEESTPNPLSVYGSSKWEGEKALAASGANHIVLRTSWVFSAKHQNFVKTMLRLGAERESLSVVADQSGAPTSADFLADMTRAILARNPADPGAALREGCGLYHLTCGGTTTWHGFAEAIFAGARARGKDLAIKEVLPIATSAYPTPARRPLNSRLDCRKFHRTFGTVPTSWETALGEALDELCR